MIICGTVLLAGCFTAKMAKPSQDDADRANGKFAGGVTLAQLNEGKELYTNNCGTCHGLKKPGSETEEKWRKIVPAMVKKVNKNSMVLNKDQEELILKYVVTMGSR